MSCKLNCSICFDRYTQNDEIQASNCGHIHHAKCIAEWRTRDRSCPECRQPCTELVRIYFNFGIEEESKDSLLRAKANDAIKHLSELQNEIERKERECQELHQQFEEDLKKSSGLEHEFQEKERKWLKITEDINVMRNKLLVKTNECELLSAQNESYGTEISLKTKENETLRQSFGRLPAGSLNWPRSSITARLKVIEEKLKATSMELEKEVGHCLQLSFDNIKLKKEVDFYKSLGSAALDIFPAKDQSKVQDVNVIEKMATQIVSSPKPRHQALFDNRENPILRSVIIENVPDVVKGTPFKEFVMKLTQAMQLQFVKSDIEKVNIYELAKTKPHTIAFIVQFANIDRKIKFLGRKSKLWDDPQWKDLRIKEQISATTNNLYYRALVLRSNGYAFVYCKNDMVMAKKQKDSEPIRVRNFNHVDELLSASRNEISSGLDLFKAASKSATKPAKHDDDFYSI